MRQRAYNERIEHIAMLLEVLNAVHMLREVIQLFMMLIGDVSAFILNFSSEVRDTRSFLYKKHVCKKLVLEVPKS